MSGGNPGPGKWCIIPHVGASKSATCAQFPGGGRRARNTRREPIKNRARHGGRYPLPKGQIRRCHSYLPSWPQILCAGSACQTVVQIWGVSGPGARGVEKGRGERGRRREKGEKGGACPAEGRRSPAPPGQKCLICQWCPSLPVRPPCPSVRWPVCPLACLSAGLSVRWPVCPLARLSAGPSVRWPACPLACLSATLLLPGQADMRPAHYLKLRLSLI
jgi:hypothetical protein